MWNRFGVLLHYLISFNYFYNFFYYHYAFWTYWKIVSKDLKKIKGLKISESSNFLDYENETNYDNQF